MTHEPTTPVRRSRRGKYRVGSESTGTAGPVMYAPRNRSGIAAASASTESRAVKGRSRAPRARMTPIAVAMERAKYAHARPRPTAAPSRVEVGMSGATAHASRKQRYAATITLVGPGDRTVAALKYRIAPAPIDAEPTHARS